MGEPSTTRPASPPTGCPICGTRTGLHGFSFDKKRYVRDEEVGERE